MTDKTSKTSEKIVHFPFAHTEQNVRMATFHNVNSGRNGTNAQISRQCNEEPNQGSKKTLSYTCRNVIEGTLDTK